MAHNVIAEAKKCLNCQQPLCVEGCPLSAPIPQFISAFLDGRIGEAGKMLFDNNPLSVVCAMVCNYSQMCQAYCEKAIKGSPVEIASIEKYISERYLETIENKNRPDNKLKVAVVGSGPAGITIATVLAGYGYRVTVFESKTDIGGALRFGIPEYRLPKEIIDRYKKLMLDAGIKIRLNITIGNMFGIRELLRDGFAAISVSTGVTWPLSLNIKGETLGNVHYGVHFLERPEGYELGKSVIVIGGGNVAMDVARTAIRMGVRDVKIVIRSDKFSANAEQLQYAEIEGAQFFINLTALEITSTGVLFAESVSDENHRVKEVTSRTTFIEGDTVFICASQRPSRLLLTDTEGLELDENGFVKVDEYGQTSLPGVFAAGDVVRGAKTVAEAVKISKRVAEGINIYLKGKYNLN